jgi:hypothetical protein
MSRYLTGLIALALLPAAHAGELGRLFNTPQQRQQMDISGTSNDGGSAENGGVSRNYIIVNGVVQKQGGKRTVWINGAQQAAERGNDKTPASVPVSVPGKVDPVHLKVGQKLLLDTPAPDTNESKPAEEDD